MALVITDVQGYIGTLTFNNYDKRNALSRDFILEIMHGLNELIYQRVRVIVLRAGPGCKVWSAGHDISELERPGRDPLSYDDPLEQLIRAVQKCPCPVIAMLEGSVWGGACELAFVCDLLMGTPQTTFAITPAKLGIPYNPSGLLHLLNMCGLAIIKEMFFTARPVSAERAVQLGLLNHLVPVEELESVTYELARQITENSPLSVSVMKEQLRILGNAMPISPETFERIQGLRRLVWDSQDYIEGKTAFLERRKAVFKGE